MKKIRLIVVVSIMTTFLIIDKTNAQRRVVVRTPNKTIIRTTSPRVVYRRPIPAVRAVRVLPNTAVVVKRNGLSYYYSGGLYYRYYNGRYVVVAAPLGVRVRVLPVGYTRIVIYGRPYFYYRGNYYIQVSNGYKIVEAPENITVPELPEEAEQVDIDGKSYYEYNNTLYKTITTPEGKQFKVVGGLED